ncbi:MAG: alpha/beta fold hydrolase [Proteobacteria bacterium]|nr:alpha/beta fold hydrolase [Pseudomonadota bacterium]
MITALSLFVAHAAGLALYVAWVASRLAANPSAPLWPYVVGAPLLYAALVLAITLTDFALAWVWRTPRAPGERIEVGRTLRMIAQEFVALLPSGLRMMTYPLTRRARAAGPDPLPVVLVHGVLCNGGVWGDVERACIARGMPPPFRISYGPPLASIDVFAAQLATRVDAVVAQTGARRIVIVAHSMGGLVTRAYLAKHGAARVAQVITLGTPWRGSRFAGLAVGSSLAQMRPGNPWLAHYPPRVDGAPPFMSIRSPHDSMVAPQDSCVLEGARDVAFVGRGHNALLHDTEVIACVVDELARLRALAAAPTAASAAATGPAQGQAG